MDVCSTTCQRKVTVTMDDRVMEAAERLACLLTKTSTFQNYVQMSQQLRQDNEVSEIVHKLNGYGYEASMAETEPATALQTRLESLPAIRSYRQSEQDTREIFHAVNETISAAAGLPFAKNAHPSADG